MHAKTFVVVVRVLSLATLPDFVPVATRKTSARPRGRQSCAPAIGPTNQLLQKLTARGYRLTNYVACTISDTGEKPRVIFVFEGKSQKETRPEVVELFASLTRGINQLERYEDSGRDYGLYIKPQIFADVHQGLP